MSDIQEVSWDDSPAELLRKVKAQMRLGVPAPVRVSKNGKRIGQRPRIHDALVDQITGLIARGVPIYAACGTCGIGRSTVKEWEARGLAAQERVLSGQGCPPSERPYLAFSTKMRAARDYQEAAYAGKLRDLAMGETVAAVTITYDDERDRMVERVEFNPPSVRALTFALERGHGWVNRQEISGPGGGPISAEVEVSARDLLRQRLQQVATRVGIEQADEEDLDDEDAD